MSQRVMLDGNGAASQALMLADIKVVSAYPITPQSPIAEGLATYSADGRLKAKYIRVESEHTALSCAIGAQLTGVRAGTATSSVGLALMYEILNVASGLRIPIVMPVVNRAFVAPWSLWCDHQDAMSARDTGWLQLYAQNAQEVLDLCLIAYKVAEDERVLLPCMVCMDGFFVSHAIEPVILPNKGEADAFLPPYEPKNLLLDVDNPYFINNLTPPAEYAEMKYQMRKGMDASHAVLIEAFADYEKKMGRRYDFIESYRCEDAEEIMVVLGSAAGAVRQVVDKLRGQGRNAGMLKITSFRPFPVEEIRAALSSAKYVGVIDRNSNLGSVWNPVATEIRSALQGKTYPKIVDYICGLGGRDLTPETVEKAFSLLISAGTGEMEWVDLRADAMDLREVGEDD